MSDGTDPMSEIGEATGLPMPAASRDEEDWEGFLLMALDHLNAQPGQECIGISNTKLAEIEDVVGMQLPFEVGMLLIMGVPDTQGWTRWEDSPQQVWDEWNNYLRGGLVFDVEHNDYWTPDWGPRPAEVADRKQVAADNFAKAPALFPLYGHRCVPLETPVGHASNMGNPVFSIVQTDIIVYGADLAQWLHTEFGVPLPVWTHDQDRTFPFWSEMLDQNG